MEYTKEDLKKLYKIATNTKLKRTMRPLLDIIEQKIQDGVAIETNTSDSNITDYLIYKDSFNK